MVDEIAGFQVSLVEAKRHYATLPDSLKEDILSQVTVAHALMEAYAEKRIDKETGELVPLEAAHNALSMCLTTLRENNVTSLANYLSSQLEHIDTSGPAALKLSHELRMVKQAFQQKPGESPGDLNRIHEANERMAWLREQTRRKRLEDLKPAEKIAIMEKTKEMLDYLTPTERMELYTSSRFGTHVDSSGMASFDAFHDSLILLTSVLALATFNPLAIGVAAGTAISRVKALVMPEDPAKAFDDQLKQSQRPSTEVRLGVPRDRDGQTRGGGGGMAM